MGVEGFPRIISGSVSSHVGLQRKLSEEEIKGRRHSVAANLKVHQLGGHEIC